MTTVHVGDCLVSLRAMHARGERVQTCVTSPPYFGLRDYGHAGQIGLEETPTAYVAKMVEVFNAVRDVLADDGTLWLNLGDSYAGSGKGGNPVPGKQASNVGSESVSVGRTAREADVTNVTRKTFGGIKAKDLIGIPWRVAFALQAAGWWLRQDIIWAKPNPMPESVLDRCTRSHEYLFMLSKSADYFFDSAAIREKATSDKGRGATGRGKNAFAVASGCNGRRPQQDHSGWMGGDGETRNRRDVWTVTIAPYKGAHFATFPPKLIEPCILAGSRAGQTVLDPFGGSGTTAQVAAAHGRHAVLCELNPDYVTLINQRVYSSAYEGI